VAIEHTPENIAKAHRLIEEAEASAANDERIADWLSDQADDLRRRALRERAHVEPYRLWLGEADWLHEMEESG
jgi:hypothetical protein